MKKILYTLLLLAITIPYASAGIREGTTADNDFLLKTNYSESTAKVVDTIRARNNYDTDFQYERVYVDKYPENAKQYSGLFYRKIKSWFDPMADDHFFGEHEINFDNKFFQMEPSFKDYLKDSREHNKNRPHKSKSKKSETL